jgi:xanthine dehydrogenase accessory factor
MTESSHEHCIYKRLEAALGAQELVTQAMRLTKPHQGSKMLLFPDGRTFGSLGSEALEQAVQAEAMRMMSDVRGKLAHSMAYALPEGNKARVFIEVYLPPPHLIIFGGVHIALPLVTFAKTLGFRVTVADPRTTFANRQRFPDVDEIIPEWPEEALKQLTIGPSSYCVILTHDPKLDEPALEGLLGKNAAYVGAIGSRKTHAERFKRMAGQVEPQQLAQVYAPIGLNLNAQTPEEIALAVMAEIVAVRRGAKAGFMKDGYSDPK